MAFSDLRVSSTTIAMAKAIWSSYYDGYYWSHVLFVEPNRAAYVKLSVDCQPYWLNAPKSVSTSLNSQDAVCMVKSSWVHSGLTKKNLRWTASSSVTESSSSKLNFCKIESVPKSKAINLLESRRDVPNNVRATLISASLARARSFPGRSARWHCQSREEPAILGRFCWW